MSRAFDKVGFEIKMPRILAWIIGLALVVGVFSGYIWMNNRLVSLDKARDFRVQILNNAWYEMCQYRDFDAVIEPDYRTDPGGYPRGIYHDAFEVWTSEVPYWRNELLDDGTKLARVKLDAETEAEFDVAANRLEELCRDNVSDFYDVLYEVLY